MNAENRLDQTVVAVLSTTVLPIDGTYEVKTLTAEERASVFKAIAGEMNPLKGVPHYIGHPDTKQIVEALGAVQAQTKLFAGLKVGELAVCFPIKQGLSTRASEGFTAHQAISEIETLDVRVLRRTA